LTIVGEIEYSGSALGSFNEVATAFPTGEFSHEASFFSVTAPNYDTVTLVLEGGSLILVGASVVGLTTIRLLKVRLVLRSIIIP
jgi:hypothetical protein